MTLMHSDTPRLSLVFDLGVAIIWILVVLTSTLWEWAMLYMELGLFDALEPAFFSWSCPSQRSDTATLCLNRGGDYWRG